MMFEIVKSKTSGMAVIIPTTILPRTKYTLIPLNPQESLVVYRQPSAPRQARLPFPAQQLWLFELVS